jgi:hypothetical protein
MLNLFKLNKFHLLAAIVLLGVLLRFYKINNPVADWHAFRQADTASVTLEYVKAEHIDLLRPRYHDLSNIQSGLDNPDGYRMVEFPFINALLAMLIKTTSLDFVLVSRLAAILASLLSLVVIYKLTAAISGVKTALLSSLFFAILPYSVFYSRAILPEPYVILFSTYAIWQFYLFATYRRWSNFILSCLSLALAALLKPFVVFLAPVFVEIIFTATSQISSKRLWLDWRILIFPILAFAPLLAWREWILQFPSGVPASDWLLNGNGIRLQPAWWRWIFYERIIKLFLGFAGVILLFSNLLHKHKDMWIYGMWWLGLVAYFVIIATGNVQHDYYQNLMLPIISISLGRGAYALQQFMQPKIGQLLSILLVISITALSLVLAWQQIKGYFAVNNWEYVKAGQAADQLLPQDALVIAPAMGDTYFLLQTKRRGWPIGFEIEDKIAKGAQYYVSSTYDWEAKMLEEQYQTLVKNEDYIIIDLRKHL